MLDVLEIAQQLLHSEAAPLVTPDVGIVAAACGIAVHAEMLIETSAG